MADPPARIPPTPLAEVGCDSSLAERLDVLQRLLDLPRTRRILAMGPWIGAAIGSLGGGLLLHWMLPRAPWLYVVAVVAEGLVVTIPWPRLRTRREDGDDVEFTSEQTIIVVRARAFADPRSAATS